MPSETFENVELSGNADQDLIRQGKARAKAEAAKMKTIPIELPATRPAEDDGRTLMDLPSSVKVNPAVGWLVCIDGVDKGKSFRLVRGNNPIGRPGSGKNYAISLTDQAISRKGACGVVVYNDKTNQFYITPGDLTTNINPYLDNEILLSPKLLNPRAKLEVAGDVLLFIPFCSDQFKWIFVNPAQNQPPVRRGSAAPEPAGPQNDVSGNIVRCEKGHYYNALINKTCPYCASAQKDNNPDGQTLIF